MIGFHELYERHWHDVYRFALFLSGNRAQAEDLASDTFMRAWTARGPIREPTVRAYLLTITRNLWRDMKRREARLVPLEAAPVAAVAARGDALAELGWTERQLALIAAGDRAALMLVARDGLSYEEVARRLDISVGAVKSRVFRARQALGALREPGTPQGESR
jgi:RNA polymerase sigma-70 factor (ECF subfamily)